MGLIFTSTRCVTTACDCRTCVFVCVRGKAPFVKDRAEFSSHLMCATVDAERNNVIRCNNADGTVMSINQYRRTMAGQYERSFVVGCQSTFAI